MKEWEKDVPLGIVNTLNTECKGATTTRCLEILEGEDLDTLTSTTRIRGIAKGYSKRHRVPIRISKEFFKDHPYADAVHTYRKGKSVIYLHPLLKYYPEEYIRGTIEHEIDHMKVEKKWEDIL